MSNELEFKYEVEIKTSEKKQLLPKEVRTIKRIRNDG